jgi:uncharacterized protein YlxW (UPF0749 family)
MCTVVTGYDCPPYVQGIFAWSKLLSHSCLTIAPQAAVLTWRLCTPSAAVLQATKLQALYAQAQADLETAEGKVVSLSAELEAAQDTAEKLRREMRNLQVRWEKGSRENSKK